jgi:prolipoprotein diacylglyceryl transferase
LAEILLPFRFSPKFEFTGFQGLASHGAAIGIILAMYFFSKSIMEKPLLWVLDRVVIPVVSGAVFVRIGNFFNSEIIGHETTSAFGIKFIRDYYNPREAVNATKIANPKEAYNAIATNPQFAELLAQVPAKHPTQLYESFCYIFVFAVLYYMYWKTDARKKQGYLLGMFLVMLWSVRFVVEFMKESQGGFESDLGIFSTGQWLSIPFIIIGFFLIFKSKKMIQM